MRRLSCLVLLLYSATPHANALTIGAAECPDFPKVVNEFGFRMIKATSQIDGCRNEIVSPLSAAICLSMLANGSLGATRDSITKALGFRSAELSPWNAQCRKALNAMSGANDSGLTFANSLWVFAKRPPPSTYLDLLDRSFQAEAFRLDSPGREAVDEINRWAKVRSKNRIEKAIEQIDPRSFAVLLSCLSFDNAWKTLFDPRKTWRSDFHMPNGKIMEVPMMVEKIRTRGGQFEDGTTALVLPYASEDWQILLMLPSEQRSPEQLIKKLDSAKLKQIEEDLVNADCDVMVPRFSLAKTSDTRLSLTRIGLGRLFLPLNDFSLITPGQRHAFISQVVQQNQVRVDEQGTHTSTVTRVIATFGVGAIHLFVANRPFLYFLQHKPTGTILLMGICNDPNKTD